MSRTAFDRFVALTDHRRRLVSGDRLFERGTPVRSLYLVIDGELCLERDTVEGAALILQRARPGSVVAEASLRAERYHCGCRASRATTVATLPIDAARAALQGDAALANAWATDLARELQGARARSEILRLRGVAARLDAWQAMTGASLPAHGEGRGLAEEIGVTPEALYRELSRRRGAA